VARVLPPAFASDNAPAIDASGEYGRQDPGTLIDESPDPFANLPRTRRITARVALSAALVICSLALVGLIITSASPAAGVRRWDSSISRDLADSRSRDFVQLAEWFSGMADTRPIIGIMALVTIILAACRQWRAILLLPVAMFVEITGFLAVNYLVARPRPEVTKIGPIPSTYSFPSGHVAATFVCWFGSALLLYAFGRTALSKALAAIAVVMTVGTGWARVYLGMHHTLDVAIGLVLGIAALAIAVRSLDMPVEQLRATGRAAPFREAVPSPPARPEMGA